MAVGASRGYVGACQQTHNELPDVCCIQRWVILLRLAGDVGWQYLQTDPYYNQNSIMCVHAASHQN
jgi:hypothetical protein